MNTPRLLLAALFAATLGLSGCSTTGGGSDDGAKGGADVVEGGGASTNGAGGTRGSGMNPLDDPSSPLAVRKIYFDFDKAEIKAESVTTLRAHADYLNANRLLNITIEGHCDERGSREYNIGLGERRADAIKRFLEAEGVDRSQINTISYGEERPEAFGHDEAAWAQNRRGVLVY